MSTKAKPLPAIEDLRERLNYDHKTGQLTWKKPLSNKSRIKEGQPVGKVNPHTGYRQFWFMGRTVYAHRVAFYMHTGIDPLDLHVDHINHDTDDNRIENLRLASNSENLANQLGCAGVRQRKGRWIAAVTQLGKEIYLGTYDSYEDAHAAYIAVKQQLFGEFCPA